MNNISEKFPKVKLPPGHYFFRDCLRECVARWIQWGIRVDPLATVWFVTLTFKREIAESLAIKFSNSWLEHLSHGYSFKTGHRIRWVRVMALQKRGVIHFHLVVCGCGLGLLSRKSWERRWEAIDRSAGFCRIYDSDSVKTSRYLAREISKEGDITWGGDWRGLSTPGAVSCCGFHSLRMVPSRVNESHLNTLRLDSKAGQGAVRC